MNLKLNEIFHNAKARKDVKESYNQIAALCEELQIRKPHSEYDEWDIYIGKDDQLCFCSKDDLIIEDLSDRIWLPIQLNGKTCRLQIDDLIATALKTQDPDKIREIYLNWLTEDVDGPQMRWGNEVVLKLEFYRDILNKKLGKKHKS